MIDKRVSDIIYFLKRNRKGTFSEMESELGINQSQLKYSIKKFNDFLKENGIEQVDGNHQSLFINDEQYRFLIHTKETDFAEDYILNGAERQKLIFLLLLAQDEEFISLAHFYDLLQVGKTTISQDIKELTLQLAPEKIYLDYSRQNGYRLVGDELAIRSQLFRWIMADFARADRMVYTLYLRRFKQIDLDEFIAKLKDLNQSFGLQFVEDRFAEFSCFFALVLNRLKNTNSQYAVDPVFDFKQFKEYHYTKNLCASFDLQSENEQFYLCAWMLGQSVGNLDEMTPDRDYILGIVDQIMRNFEKLSGIFFSDREETIKQLYAHLRPCYYRLLFQFPLTNQLVSKIKKEYRDIYYLVSETVKENDKLMAHGISEDEIAYLTIHFASVIEKNGKKLKEQSIKAVVVCSHGIGSSAIIFEELRNLFPEIFFIGPLSMADFKQLDVSDMDMIFSTTVEKTMLESQSSVFFINPIMTAAEKYKLVRNVYEKIGLYHLPDVDKILEIIGKHTQIDCADDLKKELASYLRLGKKEEDSKPRLRLSHLLLPQYIKKIPVAMGTEDILENLAQPLIDDEIINSNYLEAIKEEVESPFNTFHIAPGVLLPHTEPSKGANGLAISLGILEEPQLINDKEINYIFLLAAIDNKQHISAMADLVKLITNPEMTSELHFQASIEDMYSFIKRNEV